MDKYPSTLFSTYKQSAHPSRLNSGATPQPLLATPLTGYLALFHVTFTNPCYLSN